MNKSSKRKSLAMPAATSPSLPPSARKDATRLKIEQMELERKERRKSMIQLKQARKEQSRKNIAEGNPGDIDFIGMVGEWRRKQQEEHKKSKPPTPSPSNICIAVRKRPMFEKERAKLDHDSVSCYHPKVWIHSAKFKVDGITKYLTHNSFQLDHAFGEDSTTQQIYLATTLPLVDHVVSTQGRATVFCYGQTGSGKTYTMNGIQQILAHDLYGQLAEVQSELDITVAFFELYGGYCQDLLHGRKRCKLLEDGKGEINITGLQEVPAPTAEDFLKVIEKGHGLRTTQKTEANDTSSRSHAICQVFLRDPETGKLKGKLGLVDLAGSERGSDTKSHNAQRRAESAEINTSLLSLKECIRALGQKSSHVPYRGSKLTLILKDCFSPDSKTTMIATVSPGASSTDHSLNTLRYADRIKEQRTTPSTKGPRGGTNSPRATLPSKQRLARIAAATGLTIEHQKENIDESFSQRKSLSPNRLINESFDGVEELELSDDGLTDILEEEDDLQSNPTMEEEAELRRVVQTLFELEESLLNQHMSNIQENAEMLTQEGKLLQRVQAGGLSEDEMDNYAIQLAEYLDRKEALIHKLQSKLNEFQNQLVKEQHLAKRVTKLTQY